MSIIGAMYKGIFDSYDPMEFDCPSGNCNWNPFESIGICNSCVDVTVQTNASMWCEDTDIAPWDNSTIGRTCTYETPSGYRLEGNAVNWFYMRSYAMHHTLWNSTPTWDTSNRSQGTQEPDPGIATIAALKWVEYDDQAVGKPEIWLEAAYECSLNWCAKEYNNTLSSGGTLTDDPTHISPLTFMDTAACKYNDTSNSTWRYLDFSPTGQNITKFVIPAYKDGEVPFLPCNYTSGEAYNELVDDPKAFWVNQQDNMNLQKGISDIFTATFETITESNDNIGRSLYRSTNLTQTMDDIARSMTNVIRMGPNQTDIRGTVEIPEQHIHVRWEWMILPIGLVLASIIFLAVSMTYSTAGSKAIWKGSAMPSFYHGLSGWEASQVTSRNLEDMEKRAKDMWAILKEDENGSLKLMRSGRSL
jgi:hypothetical protein